MEQIRLAIGVPAYGGMIASEQITMWAEIGGALAGDPEDAISLRAIMNVDTCGVDRARNLLIDNARRVGAEWLLMIDADTWIVQGDHDPPTGTQLFTMIVDAAKVDATIVGAPVQRRDGGGLTVYEYETIPSPAHLVPIDTRRVPRRFMPTELIEVGAVAPAVMAINLKKIDQLRFVVTDTLDEGIYLCQEVRKLGGKIMCDGRVRTAHRERPKALYSR